MPDVAVGQFISTEEIVSQEKVIDMDPKMRLLDPDQTQFVTMTSRSKSRPALAEKVNWLEEQYINRIVTLTAAYTANGPSLTVSAPATGSRVIRSPTSHRSRTSSSGSRTPRTCNAMPMSYPMPARCGRAGAAGWPSEPEDRSSTGTAAWW